jgi:hypothetical protein
MRPAALALALALAAPGAHALEAGVGAGAALGNVTYLASAGPAAELRLETTGTEGRIRLGLAYLGAVRQDTGEPYTADIEIDPIWNASLQAVYRIPVRQAVVEAGAGLGVRSNAANADYLLPSRINASLTAGIRVGRWYLEARHLSNAWTRDSNRGANWVVAGVAF